MCFLINYHRFDSVSVELSTSKFKKISVQENRSLSYGEMGLFFHFLIFFVLCHFRPQIRYWFGMEILGVFYHILTPFYYRDIFII